MSTNLSGYSKYSVALMPLINTERFSEAPNPTWLKRDILVSSNDITKIFQEFQNKIGFPIGPTSFIPEDFEGVKVYFDSVNLNSLFIVAKSEEIADDYAGSLKLKKPYNINRNRRRDSFSYPWEL